MSLHSLHCARIGAATLLCFFTTLCGAAETDAPPVPQSTQAIGREAPWPLTIKSGDTVLTVFHPQLDRWDGNFLAARFAVQAARSKRTSYGIVNVDARTLTDKGTRVVTIDKVEVAKADFPSDSAEDSKAWTSAIARELGRRSRTVALDRLEAQLADAGAAQAAAAKPLRNDPPKIVFSSTPAILVSIDGQPVYRPTHDAGYERVINTRPLLVRDKAGVHYLKIFDGWMSAPSLGGSWSVLVALPTGLHAVYLNALDARAIDPLTGKSSSDKSGPSLAKTVPTIYFASEPTELIVTDGAPKYVPIAETQLLYVENTTGRVFKDTADNRTYVLVSGRWFRAADEQGPWEYVAANALPAGFASIPDESPVENAKASVSGTPQAREAAVAAGVPQTAAVKISGTKLTPPSFDGDPVYRPIAGTQLQYVANTAMPIIRADDGSLYALQNGVWFVSTSVTGPWRVATSVPASIYTIPPDSPLHYVTFVKIYSVTADTVYVGYTPGYFGTYVDPVTGVVVYGTGYSYDPWTGTVWYGAPVTYGYAASVAYTPWDGWAFAFGFGWFWGAATVAWGWGWGPYPYWGPWYGAWGVAYGAAGGAVAWGPGGWAGYTGNVYRQWGDRATVSRAAGGYNAWTGNAWAAQAGKSYNSRTGIASAGQRGAVHNVYTGNFAAGARGVATGPGGNVVVGERGIAGNTATGNAVSGNRGAYYDRSTGQWTTFAGATGSGGGRVARVGDDVYAGKDGNVYRHTGNGWEQHSAGGWQPVAGGAQGEATRGATGGLGGTQSRLGDLDRERGARHFGGERAQQLRQSSFGMHRGFRGGGRRR